MAALRLIACFVRRLRTRGRLREYDSQLSRLVLHNVAEVQAVSKQGYVLGPNEGEHLIRNAGSLFIKVDPSRGSNNMALGTQQVPIRAGILSISTTKQMRCCSFWKGQGLAS